MFRPFPAILSLIFLSAALPLEAGTMAPDPGTVACRKLLAMNHVGQITVAMATKEAMHSDASVQSMSDEDVLRLALRACARHPDTNVLSAVTD